MEVQRALQRADPNRAFLEIVEGGPAAAGGARPDAELLSAHRSPGADREITLTVDESDQLLVILNDVVVSLDRIGSREASGEDPGHAWIHEYFSTGGPTVRLAQARYVLDVAINRVYTEDEQVAMWDERPWPDWAVHLLEIASKPKAR